jgi:hypothetical protein
MIDPWDRYLLVGGYPQAVESELTTPQGGADAALRDALWDVIHGDAFEGSELSPTQTQIILRSIFAARPSRFRSTASKDWRRDHGRKRTGRNP